MFSDQVPYSPEVQALVLRTERPEDAAAVLEAARRTVQRVAPGVAVQEATTMEQVFDKAVGTRAADHDAADAADRRSPWCSARSGCTG